MDVVESFFSVAEPAQRLLESPEVASSWDRPSALAEYSVAGLAGHLVRAVGRIELLIERPEPTGAELVGLAAFFGANRVEVPADRDSELQRAVRRDGEAAGLAGPVALALQFGQLVERLRPLLAATARDRLVPVFTIQHGATTLEDYMRSRVVEVVVHTDDLAASVGVTAPEPGPEPASVVIGVLLELARDRRGNLAVIRALSRSERAGPDALRAL